MATDASDASVSMSSRDNHTAVINALSMMKRVRRLSGVMFIHGGVLLHSDTAFPPSQTSAFVRILNAILDGYRQAGRGMERFLFGYDSGNVLVFDRDSVVVVLFFASLSQLEMVENGGELFLNQFSSALGIGGEKRLRLPAQRVAKPESQPAPEVAAATRADELAAIPAAFGDEAKPGPEPEPAAPEPEPATPEPGPASEPCPTPEPVVAVAPEPSLPAAPVREAESEAVPEPKPAPDQLPSAASVVPATPAPDRAAEWAEFRRHLELLLTKVVGHTQAAKLIAREMAEMGVAAGGHPLPAQFRPFGLKLMQRVRDRAVRAQLESELDRYFEN